MQNAPNRSKALTYHEAVGSNIRRVRRERGLGPAEIEERFAEIGLPMTYRMLNSIESGRRPLKVNDLLGFGYALRLSPVKLLFPHVGDSGPELRWGDAPVTIPTRTIGWWLAAPDDSPPPWTGPGGDTVDLNETYLDIADLFTQSAGVADASTYRIHRLLTLPELVNEPEYAVITVDADDRIRFWNKAAELESGWTADEVRGEWLGDYLVDDWVLNTIRHRWAHFDENETYTLGIVRFRHRDGRVLHASSTIRTFVSGTSGEEVFTVVAHIVDEGSGENAARIPPDAGRLEIAVGAPEVLAGNDPATRITGWTMDEIRGRVMTPGFLLSPRVKPDVRLERLRRLAARHHARWRDHLRRKDGTDVLCEHDLVMVDTLSGQPAKIVWHFWESEPRSKATPPGEFEPTST